MQIEDGLESKNSIAIKGRCGNTNIISPLQREKAITAWPTLSGFSP
jgi:hypothetical protein